MKRYVILARFVKVPKMKWGNLFKDHRSYKTEKYAKAVIRKQEDYRPDLDFKIKPINVVNCPHCKQTIK